jgi:hypothetical protein
MNLAVGVLMRCHGGEVDGRSGLFHITIEAGYRDYHFSVIRLFAYAVKRIIE